MRSLALISVLLFALPVLGQSTATHPATTHARRRHVVHRRALPCAPAAPVVPVGLPPAVGPVQTAFSLRYIDTQAGTGALMQPGEFLTVQYTGWLASNGQKFDSSLDRSEPFTFMQGEHRVIAGWDEGFTGMRVGGKRRLFVPWQLAYGESGRGPIPAAADLIFDVELVAASTTPPGVPPPAPAPAETPAPRGAAQPQP